MSGESLLPEQASVVSSELTSESIKQRLTWLMLFRVLLSVGIGLIFVFLQATSLNPLYPSDSLPIIISVFVGIYLFNLVYLFTLGRVRESYIELAYCQLFTDTLSSGLLIYLTGGLESPLIFLFALHVLMGAVSLYRAGAWFVVIIATGVFALLCADEISQIDFERGASLKTLKYILTSGLYQFGLLSFIAALTGYLSEQNRIAQLKLTFASADMKVLRRVNEHLLMSVHSGIIYLNHQGQILIVNQATERLLSTSARELLQTQVQEIFPQLPTSLSHERLREQINDLFIVSDRGVYSWEYQSIKSVPPNGDQSLETLSSERLILDCTLSEVLYSPRSSIDTGWLIILQDVTLRRRLEEKMIKRERLASLGEVAAQIAHEIRNPLAAMMSSLELLRKTPQSTTEKGLSPSDALHHRLIDILERETQRVDGLIESFLRFSRPPKPHLNLFSLNELLSELSLIQPHKLVSHIEDEVQLFADSDQVRQIIWNLCNNAWEAGSEQVEISARLVHQTLGTDEWEIEIADRGLGFPHTLEDLDLIFRPFYTQREGGTGIGLALCRALTEQQGGSLLAQRRHGGGAIFLLYLPCSSSSTAERISPIG